MVPNVDGRTLCRGGVMACDVYSDAISVDSPVKSGLVGRYLAIHFIFPTPDLMVISLLAYGTMRPLRIEDIRIFTTQGFQAPVIKCIKGV